MSQKHVLALAGAFLLGGCWGSGDAAVGKGAKVSFHYTLKVDGQVVDSSEGREPLSVVQDTGQLIPGMTKALEGMHQGEKKSITIEAKDGYGERNPQLLQKVPKKAIQGQGEIKVGAQLQGESQGRPFRAVISAVGKDDVTLDLNHPLAGKTLHFDVEVVSVEAPQG